MERCNLKREKQSLLVLRANEVQGRTREKNKKKFKKLKKGGSIVPATLFVLNL